MIRKLTTMVAVVAAGSMMGRAVAEEPAAPVAAEKPATEVQGAHIGSVRTQMPEVTEMTLVGKVTKDERQSQDGKTVALYSLVDAQGAKTMLPRKLHKQGAEDASPAVNLEEYVGKDVTVTGKGFQIQKGDMTLTRIVEIIKIEVKAAEAPAT